MRLDHLLSKELVEAGRFRLGLPGGRRRGRMFLGRPCSLVERRLWLVLGSSGSVQPRLVSLRWQRGGEWNLLGVMGRVEHTVGS